MYYVYCSRISNINYINFICGTIIYCKQAFGLRIKSGNFCSACTAKVKRSYFFVSSRIFINYYFCLNRFGIIFFTGYKSDKEKCCCRFFHNFFYLKDEMYFLLSECCNKLYGNMFCNYHLKNTIVLQNCCVSVKLRLR
jgi:hypothetical protein